ncbi:ubiquinol-cytochrome c reductase iron-sulfur subunit [Deinococcus sp. KSM4-11]|uniref:Rieske 2Fe-2S domain-containing protein n=1 Tax=Deinococcus sp. KSM4-11 TaxID=2568654 RepID=UPI0010A3BCC9|nr:Rieske 2Fe-2S domain-containing protein [Deinococcus sp. KSM4-11]THF86435.1 ubiquinol-cytochrome c reductase iron-sulfur subunit [Deinococcus sp. KSM4-11]
MTRYKKQDPELTRRKFINAAMGGAAAIGTLSLISTLGGAKPVFRLTPALAPPMEGDVLVHADPSRYGEPVKVSDLGLQLVRAWPQGKDKNGSPVIRDQDPTSVLAIFKYPAGQIQAPTNMEGTIDGQIVAYGDRCQHAGCNVGNNDQKPGLMNCPCHSGQYDPKLGGKVIGGPPPAPLAQLPIKLDGDKIVATGFFLSKPYGFNTEDDWTKYTAQVKELLS